jgi:hypothetical protein
MTRAAQVFALGRLVIVTDRTHRTHDQTGYVTSFDPRRNTYRVCVIPTRVYYWLGPDQIEPYRAYE